MTRGAEFDLAILGGGINGAGIARDAAGRGLKVLLCEKGDLGGATSSASSKLIHGGLRYLEHFQFRLVAEALSERSILLAAAPHLVRPMRFVLPLGPGLRPAWMIGLGLFLYDRIGGRGPLPGSGRVRLSGSALGAPLKDAYREGFAYFDCVTDDARLVIANLVGASESGVTILPRTAAVAAQAKGCGWELTLEDAGACRYTVSAKALVNAAGPWAGEALHGPLGIVSRADVRLVKGSHIVLPRLYPEDHAYILQNPDRRVVFLIPFESGYTLIGTTDVPVMAPSAAVSEEEIVYLCAAASRFLKQAVTPQDVVWRYAGVRALFDDGVRDPSRISRDYVLQLDRKEGAPVLSVFGGKLTTYRRLAERALEKLAPGLPPMGPAWTAGQPLPGGNAGEPEALARELIARHPTLPAPWLSALTHRYGSRAEKVIGDAAGPSDLGPHFGGTLYAREIDYLVRSEWAQTADDVLWRRTKEGLKLSPPQRQAVADYLQRQSAIISSPACSVDAPPLP